MSSFARSLAFCFSCSGLAGSPRIAIASSASPPPTATPAPSEYRTSMENSPPMEPSEPAAAEYVCPYESP